MPVLENIKPVAVFKYFEEICGIPHGSSNTKMISDYCVEFAKEHGLRYIQDEANNIIIFKDATQGYENADPVMLQGHLDMVCEKEADCTIDFEKDGLDLCLDGDTIYANGTTLGGDDGIAIAYAFAILAADDIPHPALEAVFTVDEEIGMLGAAAMDCSVLKARTMLNMDSEEEGYLLVSCAGGADARCYLPVKKAEAKGVKVTLHISGLAGGHSGAEIDKGGANADVLLGRLLDALSLKTEFALVTVEGGTKSNAIPRASFAEIVVAKEDVETIKAVVEQYQNIFRHEYEMIDQNLAVTAEIGEEVKMQAMDAATKKNVILALVHLPRGIQRMSLDVKGLVQTSLNLGIMKTLEDKVLMCFCVRSSVGTEKEELMRRLESMMEILGGELVIEGDYPAWEYRQESRLRDLMTEVFEEMYGRKPVVMALHAGVECGLFSGKIPGLDCVSFGPDMKDIHTPNESMSVASVQRTWNYVLEILKRLK